MGKDLDMIRLENLWLGYGERTLLEVEEAGLPGASLTALIGRNGAGKSTLLRAIAGLNRRYRGRISICGDDISSLSAPEMARRLALVTTERTRIASMRCRDIVSMGRAPYTNWIGSLTATDHKMVDDALDAVGMSDYADRMMQTMSDGECQRVMIARALAQDTPVILLDEPTSFLDMPGRYALARLLRRLASDRGKCILFSTHELDIATGETDYTALMEDSRLFLMPAMEMKEYLPGSSFFR